MRIPFLLLIMAWLTGSATVAPAQPNDPRLSKASRQDKAGWIYIHLEGKPKDIGYQHGYLLAREIDDLIRTMKLWLAHSSGKDWSFYRGAVKRIFWSKVDQEYREEMSGIVEGLKAKGYDYDVYDIVVLNGNIELGQYYVPWLADRAKPGSADNKAPGNCSAFIATGRYTSDGKIAMGHNSWTDYIVGERWNVIADIVPVSGNRLFMDMMPGFIHSGDDFVITGGGILITETTITQFKGFDESGIPEFVRARKAAQYANSIDDFIRIMTTGNNGGYANDWLVGDIKTNEIARLELGLKNHPVWRTKDGIYTGSNFPSDPKLMKEETTFDSTDASNSPNSRKRRWQELAEQYKGRIDATAARTIESDSYSELSKAKESSRCVIAGRVDTDPKGCPEWGWPPFYPGGTVQGKVTTAAMAKDLTFWAHMGNPSGEDFLAAPFFQLHPEFQWQAEYLHDMKASPWTLFEAKKR
ncbi:MAG: C45 family peptidase [Bacteroidota bacterium]|nr:C45 family peptidase [Bacteroidota bacterium]MDP4214585.1 C45 family peptidase [Bacteroidota bacterium]MDP4246744.1 C45 family peptidase [Bacteroidota bacterium]MDP4253849.1 C45 family peptidase [Bacteroidota bacterium]MDP4257888.1 C45 family peptidase [Bacteroidota bacterium]